MNISTLSNKAARDITESDFIAATAELGAINSTISAVSYGNVDGTLRINFTAELGGEVVSETGLKMGGFISLIKNNISSAARNQQAATANTARSAAATKKEIAAAKAAAKKAAKAAEIKNLIAELAGTVERESYEERFLNDIENKKTLTAKQHNFLAKIAARKGYTLALRKTPAAATCEHQDLASFGFTHGDLVRCPNCGTKTRVW